MNNKTTDKLDQIFQKYTEEKGFENTLLKYKTIEVKNQITGKRILDVGCGVGIMTNQLATNTNKIVSIDGSVEKIKIAKKKHPKNVEYILTLFSDYHPEKLFDSIIMTNVLEHIKEPIKFLKEINNNWLNTKGRVIITVPNALALHKQLGKEMGYINDYFKLTDADIGKGHFKNYSMDSLQSDIA